MFICFIVFKMVVFRANNVFHSSNSWLTRGNSSKSCKKYQFKDNWNIYQVSLNAYNFFASSLLWEKTVPRKRALLRKNAAWERGIQSTTHFSHNGISLLYFNWTKLENMLKWKSVCCSFPQFSWKPIKIIPKIPQTSNQPLTLGSQQSSPWIF